MTSGYASDPAQILARRFEADVDELVLVRGIRFTSLCEHHLLSFSGVAHVGYIPGAARTVVGLSKIPRLVECYAKRLQLQERMTRQIADAMDAHLKPRAVGVVIAARHSCMSCRGVRQPDAEMVTSAMLGMFREDPAARAEFLSLCRRDQ